MFFLSLISYIMILTIESCHHAHEWVTLYRDMWRRYDRHSCENTLVGALHPVVTQLIPRSQDR